MYIAKQKQTHGHRKQIYGYQREEGEEGRTNQEFGIKIYTLYIKQITNKNLQYSTENSTQYLVTIYNERECKKKNIYIFIYV